MLYETKDRIQPIMIVNQSAAETLRDKPADCQLPNSSGSCQVQYQVDHDIFLTRHCPDGFGRHPGCCSSAEPGQSERAFGGRPSWLDGAVTRFQPLVNVSAQMAGRVGTLARRGAGAPPMSKVRAATPCSRRLAVLALVLAACVVAGPTAKPAAAQSCVGTVSPPPAWSAAWRCRRHRARDAPSTAIAASRTRNRRWATCAWRHRSPCHPGPVSARRSRSAPCARRAARPPATPRTACSSTSGRRAPRSRGASACRSWCSSMAVPSSTARAPCRSTTAPISPRPATWSW